MRCQLLIVNPRILYTTQKNNQFPTISTKENDKTSAKKMHLCVYGIYFQRNCFHTGKIKNIKTTKTQRNFYLPCTSFACKE